MNIYAILLLANRSRIEERKCNFCINIRYFSLYNILNGNYVCLASISYLIIIQEYTITLFMHMFTRSLWFAKTWSLYMRHVNHSNLSFPIANANPRRCVFNKLFFWMCLPKNVPISCLFKCSPWHLLNENYSWICMMILLVCMWTLKSL